MLYIVFQSWDFDFLYTKLFFMFTGIVITAEGHLKSILWSKWCLKSIVVPEEFPILFGSVDKQRPHSKQHRMFRLKVTFQKEGDSILFLLISFCNCVVIYLYHLSDSCWKDAPGKKNIFLLFKTDHFKRKSNI